MKSSHIKKTHYSIFNAINNNEWHHLYELAGIEHTTRQPNGYWTDEKIIEDARKYTEKKKWILASPFVHKRARKRGILEQCYAHMKQPISKDDCIESAKLYKTKSAWAAGDSSKYVKALNNGWMDECSKHMTGQMKWTEELLIKDALKYGTSGQWKKFSSRAWKSARRKPELFKRCVAHMSHIHNPWAESEIK